MFTIPVVGIAIFHDSTAMCIDMPATIIRPYLTRADHLGLFLAIVPVVLQSLGFSLSDMDYASVLR